MIDQTTRNNVDELSQLLEENGWQIQELTIWHEREVTIDLIRSD